MYVTSVNLLHVDRQTDRQGVRKEKGRERGYGRERERQIEIERRKDRFRNMKYCTGT